jgi:hypothetical protein
MQALNRLNMDYFSLDMWKFNANILSVAWFITGGKPVMKLQRTDLGGSLLPFALYIKRPSRIEVSVDEGLLLSGGEY